MVARRGIRILARRRVALAEEINTLNKDLDELDGLAAPNLIAEQGISRDVAAKLLVAAGDNGEQCRCVALADRVR